MFTLFGIGAKYKLGTPVRSLLCQMCISADLGDFVTYLPRHPNDPKQHQNTCIYIYICFKNGGILKCYSYGYDSFQTKLSSFPVIVHTNVSLGRLILKDSWRFGQQETKKKKWLTIQLRNWNWRYSNISKTYSHIWETLDRACDDQDHLRPVCHKGLKVSIMTQYH